MFDDYLFVLLMRTLDSYYVWWQFIRIIYDDYLFCIIYDDCLFVLCMMNVYSYYVWWLFIRIMYGHCFLYYLWWLFIPIIYDDYLFMIRIYVAATIKKWTLLARRFFWKLDNIHSFMKFSLMVWCHWPYQKLTRYN